MASPSSWTSTHTLRASSSYNNIRPSALAGAVVEVGGPGISTTTPSSGAPRDVRRERRKPPISSLNQHTSSISPSAFTTNASASSEQYTEPLSHQSSRARLEEDYLAAKQRTHRQSYFDYYPERGGPRVRGDKEKGTKKERDILRERGREGEGRREPTLPDASAFVAPHRCTHDDNDDNEADEDDRHETFGRSTIRKSLSVGASCPSAPSASITGPSLPRKSKERDWATKDREERLALEREREENFDFPSIRTTRSAHHHAERSPHAYLHPKASITSSSSHTLTAAKVPPHTHPHPYGSFRDDIPALRHSYSTYSSSQTQAETPTPPLTPVEAGSRGSLDQVVVAAPTPGVEAMDALVDGMDGSDEDELFNRLQKPIVHAHHPLYAPPLPAPPPGICLGRADPYPVPRRGSINLDNEDNEQDEIRDRTTVMGGAARTSTKGRYDSRRSPSCSTIVSDLTDFRHNFSIMSISSGLEPSSPPPPSIKEIVQKCAATPSHHVKAVVPSISEIIRRNTPPVKQPRARPSNEASSRASSAHGHGVLHDFSGSEPEPEPLSPAEEAELMARSSIDSVAAEVQQTLRAQQMLASASPHKPPAPSTAHVQEELLRYSYYSHKTTRSAGGCDQSIKSGSASTSNGTGTGSGSGSGGPPGSPPEPELSFLALQHGGGQKKQSSQKDAIATYLRSARITTLLKLTRRPHASPDRPLTVSLSDLGSPTGFPLIVFLGLGCVRYVMGLYDEMAECLGLRLITIDRWGLGRTDVPPSSASREVPEWSTVVDEVLDRLNINRCSIMAHSAGAPYALSFASKYPDRIVGDICLLAPWVGGGAGGGYRWLKYVPNGILKTAQAAEWKMQAWMIGKPPKITYKGIGYNVKAPVSSDTCNNTSDFSFSGRADGSPGHSYPYATGQPAIPRKSMSSGNTFSDYDDLEDFDGRFESCATFGQQYRRSTIGSASGHSYSQPQLPPGHVTKKKPSKAFLRIWKAVPSHSTAHTPPMPSIEATLQQQEEQRSQPALQAKPQGRKLKTLRSIGSLRKTNANSVPPLPKTADKSPMLPQQEFDTTLGLDDLSITKPQTPPRPSLELDTKIAFPCRSAYSAVTAVSEDTSNASPTPTGLNHPPYGRMGGRRSISFTATTASYSFLSRPPSYSGVSQAHSSTSSTPHASTNSYSTGHTMSANPKKAGESYEVALGNALIAASHAESARGTHADLLQILNHEQRPWGFSYARYPHRVRVWYGDRDERIAANAVHWMESAMGAERCAVTVVKGADHGLMYRTSVVVDVLEQVHDVWQDARPRERALSYDDYEFNPFKPVQHELLNYRK